MPAFKLHSPVLITPHRARVKQIMERNMRILLCGAAAIALSGCSWLGYTTDGYSNGSAVSGHNSGGTYSSGAYGSAVHHGSGGVYNPQFQTGSHSAGQMVQGQYHGQYDYPVAQTYPVGYDHSAHTSYSQNTYNRGAHHSGAYHGAGHNSGHSAHGGYAGKRENPWTVMGALGADIPTGGVILRGTNAAGANFNNITHDDAFDAGLRAELGVARSLRKNRMVTGNLFWAENEGQRVNLRDTGAGLSGKFSDHESYGAELGLRQYVTLPKNPDYKPYVEGRVGAAYIDDINIEDFRSNAAAAGSGTNVSFLEGGWVPTGAALIGVERPISSNAMLGLETGLRYSGALDGGNVTGAAALAGANDYDERWSVPVNIRGRYRF